MGSGTLRQAADSYARAARCGYGRIPRLAPAGRRLRATARLLVLAVTVGEQDQAAAMMLVAKLAELAIAVAELRDIQRHAAQASAARTAAERLHAATCAGPSLVRPANARPAVRPHRRVRTAANLARLDFPNAFKSPRTAARESPRQEAAQPPVPSRATQPRGPGGPSPQDKLHPPRSRRGWTQGTSHSGPRNDGQEQNLTRFDAQSHCQTAVKRSTARPPRGRSGRLPGTSGRGGRFEPAASSSPN